MKNRLIIKLLCFTLVFSSFNSFAEHELMTWGEIDEEHLKMTAYEPDPDASVLYLGDYGEVFGEDIDYDSYTALKYFIRIKILTEEGLEYASKKLSYYHSQKEEIKYIEAQSFTLQEDGTVKKVVLEKDDIHTEKANEYLSYKVFSIPGAQVGSVIEYRFKKLTDVQVFIDPWYFQGTEPRLWSEIRFMPPKYTSYVTIPTGVLINKMVSEQSNITLGSPNAKGEVYRYYLENIPAFRSEPYTKNLRDYYAKVEFQLHSYVSGTGFTNALFHKWEELIEDLLESDNLGAHLKGNNKLLKEVRPIYENIADTEQKMIAIYDHVRANINWSEDYGLYSYEKLNEVYEKREGSGVQINLLLALMLQDAGIETDLMLISTRNHGAVVKGYPYLLRFNHLICRAKIGDKYHILDAKNKYRPYNIVPQNLVNCTALVLKKPDVEWVEIEPSTTLTETVNVHIKWNDEAEVTAMVMEKNEGYGAVMEQENLDLMGEKEYLNAMIEDWTDGEARNYKFQNKTEPKNLLVAQYEIDSDKFVTGDGTRLYFNTFATTGFSKNPFTLKERLFPIDFNYPLKMVSRFMIDLPKGYKVEDIPESSAITMEGEGATFQVVYSPQPNQVQVISTLQINNVGFSTLEYPALQTFFDKVVEKHAELIVFTKEE
ncbi:MAG: DUF3857 domain-containing protein [Chitinophagales bacterium]